MDRRSRFSPDPLPRDLHSFRARAASQPPRSSALSSDPLAFNLPQDSLTATLHPHPRTAQSPVRDRPAANWAIQSGPRLGRSPAVSRADPFRSSSFSATNVPEDDLWQAGATNFPSAAFEDDEEAFDTYNDAEPRSWSNTAESRFRRPVHAPGPRSRSLVATLTNPLPIGSHSVGNGFNQDWGDKLAYHQSVDNRFLNDFSPRANGTRSHSLQSTASMPASLIPRNAAIDVSNMSPFVRELGREEPRYHDGWSSLASMREEEFAAGGASGMTSRRHSVSVVQPKVRAGGFAAPTGMDDGGGGHFGMGQSMFSDDELAGDFGMLNIQSSLADHPSSLQQHAAFPYSVPTRYPAQSPPRNRLPGFHPALTQHDVAAYELGSRRQHRSPSLGRSPLRDGHYSSAARPSGLGQLNTAELQHSVRAGRSRSPLRPLGSRGVSPAGPITPTSALAPDSARFDQQHFQHQAYPSGDSGQLQAQPSNQGGILLEEVPANARLALAEFKLGRRELFYCDPSWGADVIVGDRLIVEGDRGKDIGVVLQANVDRSLVGLRRALDGANGTSPAAGFNRAKKAYAIANPQETQELAKKEDDEQKALQLCQSKVRQKKLPMQVVDCEFQWDRRKLTFYFISETRIDFRDLVRELFRLYKTRIWMSCVSGPLASNATANTPY